MDLTMHSSTFPDLRDPQVPRDAITSLLADMMTPARRSIAVQGAPGSGRTNLLAQFARSQADRSLTFFVGSSIQNENLHYFLLDICAQMAAALGKDPAALDDLDSDHLVQVFQTYQRGLNQEARKSKRPWYLVIDGIDWTVGGCVGEWLTGYALPDVPSHFRLLVTCQSTGYPPFPHDTWQILPFSRMETEHYLADLGLGKDAMDRIHERGGGLPAYLAAIRQQWVSGSGIDELLDRLPRELRGLFGVAWTSIATADQRLMQFLRTLTFSRGLIGPKTIAGVTGASDVTVREALATIPFLSLDPARDVYRFVPDSYQGFVAEVMEGSRREAEDELVRYYAQAPYDGDAVLLLPTYLATPEHYRQLSDLLTEDYVVGVLDQTRNICGLRRTLRLATEQAFAAGEYAEMPRYVLLSSALRTASTHPSSADDVEALLEIGDTATALEVAYQAMLPEDRLQLLAKVAGHMKLSAGSVPEGVMSDIEQIAGRIDPSSVRDRVVELAASLFNVTPSTAIELAERTVGPEQETAALDMLRATIALNVTPAANEPESAEFLRDRIVDKGIRDFARAASPAAHRLAAHEVLSWSNNVNHTSGRLMLLVSWCNANRADPDAHQVVSRALEVIAADPTYPIPMRWLRQLAEPLVSCAPAETIPLVARIDILKDTAVRKPHEELVRLQVALARAEYRWDPDRARERLLDAHLSIAELDEVDARCHCWARIVTSCREVDPADCLAIEAEAVTRLRCDYGELLARSADHGFVTRRLIRTIAGHDVEWALQMGASLNMAYRRDLATRDALHAYVSRAGSGADIAVIQKALSRIEEPALREIAVVGLFEIAAGTDAATRSRLAPALCGMLPAIRLARNQVYAAAFCVEALVGSGDAAQIARASDRLERSVDAVDSPWERPSLALEAAVIVGHDTPDLGRRMREQARAERSVSALADPTFAGAYMDSLLLALRALPISGAPDDEPSADLDSALAFIDAVPSGAERARLFADIALRCEIAGQRKLFLRLMNEHVVPAIDDCKDPGARWRGLRSASAAIFEWDSTWAMERLAELPSAARDAALLAIVEYLISGRPPEDVCDISAMRVAIEPRCARRVCSVLEHISADSCLHTGMRLLVQNMVRPQGASASGECCPTFIERDVLEIAESLAHLVASKLPDARNIQHDGYVIAGLALVERLRATARSRSQHAPQWHDLYQRACAIPNPADRTLVLALVAACAFPSNRNQAHSMLRRAEETLQEIGNAADRVARLYEVADAWHDANDDEAAKVLLSQAVQLLEGIQVQPKLDWFRGKILELAHQVDPEFASSLAPMIENPLREHRARLDLASHDLAANPHRADSPRLVSHDDLEQAIAFASGRLLTRLYAGGRVAGTGKEVAGWLHEVRDSCFDTAHPVAAWVIQNAIESHASPTARRQLFRDLLWATRACLAMGEKVLGLRSQSLPALDKTMPEGIRLIRAGRRNEALSTVEDWLRRCASGYVKVYDPYFRPEDLGVLRAIPGDCQVFVLTSWKAQRGVSPGDRSVRTRFNQRWREIEGSKPAEVHVVVVGTRSGTTPMHSRFVLTCDQGLRLGSSVNGIGLTDTDIGVLKAEEAASVETAFVNPLLVKQVREHGGEDLVSCTFMLDSD